MKLGITGHGPIVSTFLEAVSLVDQVEAVAIYNRPSSAAAGQAIASRFGIPAIYNDFDAFLADETVDTIYLALPNALHYEYAMRVLEAGKHAIVEKPFACTEEQALEMIALAKEKGLFLFEAISACHMPNVKKLQELLPRIGDVSIVQCNYSQYSSRYDDLMNGQLTNIFDPKMGGGCLMDINCYNIHFVTEIFGEPEYIEYFPRMGASGTDTAGIAMLQYTTFPASCIGAKDSATQSFGQIQGRYGTLTINGPVGFAPSVTLALRGQEPETFQLQPYENRLTYEVMEFQKIFEAQDFGARDALLEHSLLVTHLLEEARLSAGITFPCDMDQD